MMVSADKHGVCNECGKETNCFESSDENYSESTYGGTGLICPACVKKHGFRICHRCGDMRAPENLSHFDPAKYTGNAGYCPGCFDEECAERENPDNGDDDE